jgi:hypothetical protein
VWCARGAALSPRAVSALLLALALHAALLLGFRPPAPPRGIGEAAYPLLSLRLYGPARPFAASTSAPPLPRAQARHRAMAPSTRPAAVTDTATPSPGSTGDAGAPPGASVPTPIAGPAPQAADGPAAPPAPALDIDKLKAVARKNAGDGERHALPDAAPTLSASDKSQRALEQSRRPKCDKDYRPTLGPVGFAGLLTLPFMLKEGASDSGCHW